jgi:hypothetical protein
MEPQQTPHGQVAFTFATKMTSGDFSGAHQMLSARAQAEWPVARLKSDYEEMVSYFPAPPGLVMVVNTLEDWPDKQPGDIGWAYAAIAGDEGSEAVTVVVCDEGGKHLVRSIEWGRP